MANLKTHLLLDTVGFGDIDPVIGKAFHISDNILLFAEAEKVGKTALPNYSIQPTYQFEPTLVKTGSGSKMQSRISFSNTTGLALSGIGKRIGRLTVSS